MSLKELLPAVQALPQTEKQQLMQWLAEQLTQEEKPLELPSEAEFPVWSPHEAYEAAGILSAFLEREEATLLAGSSRAEKFAIIGTAPYLDCNTEAIRGGIHETFAFQPRGDQAAWQKSL